MPKIHDRQGNPIPLVIRERDDSPPSIAGKVKKAISKKGKKKSKK